MAEVKVGSAYATYELRYQGFVQGMAVVEQQLQRLRQLSAQPIAAPRLAEPAGTQTVIPRGEGAGARPVDPVAQAARAEQALLRQANAEARLAQAQGDGARAAQILSTALAQVTTRSVAAINTETQLERVNARLGQSAGQAATSMQALPRTIAGLSNEAAQFALQSFGLTSAVGIAAGALRSFGDAFKFKAELDGARQSIDVLLRGVRKDTRLATD